MIRINITKDEMKQIMDGKEITVYEDCDDDTRISLRYK